MRIDCVLKCFSLDQECHGLGRIKVLVAQAIGFAYRATTVGILGTGLPPGGTTESAGGLTDGATAFRIVGASLTKGFAGRGAIAKDGVVCPDKPNVRKCPRCLAGVTVKAGKLVGGGRPEECGSQPRRILLIIILLLFVIITQKNGRRFQIQFQKLQPLVWIWKSPYVNGHDGIIGNVEGFLDNILSFVKSLPFSTIVVLRQKV